jgi:hypothetical protein
MNLGFQSGMLTGGPLSPAHNGAGPGWTILQVVLRWGAFSHSFFPFYLFHSFVPFLFLDYSFLFLSSSLSPFFAFPKTSGVGEPDEVRSSTL